MELHLTPEQEIHLSQIAQHEGKDPEQLVLDAALHLMDIDDLFRQGVRRGMAQAERGEFIEEAEMDRRVEDMLRS